MGKFHGGHVSLMRKAVEECDITVVSLFVNPTQFSPGEDYEHYPRDREGDLAMAGEAGVDVLFCPDAGLMYPPDYDTKIVQPALERQLCGRYRPNHFSGVATIVLKLFNIIRPDRAYFGEKDYQQLLMIRRLVTDLNLGIEVIGCPIVREPDGLAMSSRNAYLDAGERASAASLYHSLQLAQSLVSSGERKVAVLKEKMRRVISVRPHTRIQYIAICHPQTLEGVDAIEDSALAALAVVIGKARLIDNRILKTR